MRQHLISTRATQRQCPTCRTPTLHALVDGLSVTVDAAPLAGQANELDALLRNLSTYTLTIIRKELIHRTAPIIRRPRQIPGTIHAQHACPIRQPAGTQLELPFMEST
ncbi:hypothetical protein Rhe02_55520 [Rhizocola hellebori]|uniref:Uncharacterized protein n=1 Tax=Rhizocola hellebori TaxID=1392758 RepID=A0A8J3QBE5_9ACTN|nr:hypothetical protein Rhe02_55520 [Rhizocola hellebori]